ncbi:MAG: penicillin acylase family protein [Bacteroidetes bacterium]|nr:penicillin acylase family protein [Bacteroidota bacterium]
MVAKERLWQMDFISYAAAGRISELIGDKALDFDRYNRRIGMLSAAKKTVELTEKDPATKLIVDNYTAGVNYYIEHLAQKNLPLEYKLIGYTPEKWTPLKCALLLKYMANDLTGTDNDLQNTNAINQFGRVAFDKMFPDFPQLQSPIIPVGTNFTSKTPSNQPTNSIISKGISKSIRGI